MTRMLILAATTLFAASACDVVDDEPASPMPDVSIEWRTETDPDFVALEVSTFDMQSCGISVQSPSEGQYFVDFRNFEDEAILRMWFPDTVDAPPVAGTYVVSDDALLTFSLPSPLGVMDGTSGGVLVREQDGWRTFSISAFVTNGAEGGGVEAELSCRI